MVNVFAQGINGSLLEYPGSPQVPLTLEQQETYNKLSALGTTYLVNLKDISQVGNDGVVEIDLPGTQTPTLNFEVKNAHKEANGNLYWYGTLPISSDTTNDLTGSLHFNIYEGKQFGILQVDTLIFNLFDLGNSINVITKLDQLPSTPFMNCVTNLNIDTSSSTITPELIPKNQSKYDISGIEIRENFCNEVDVLVLSTTSATNNLGNEDIVFQIAKSEINWANQALRNSHIDDHILKLNLAKVEQIDFTEIIGANPGFEILRLIFEYGHLRDSFNADIVMTFTNGDYIGLTPNGQETPIGGAVIEPELNESRAYGIIEATPNSLSNHVFVHELGHLFACRHEPESDTISGIFAKAHLFKRCFFCRRHRTIMHTATSPSFFNSNSKLIQHFSNPDVNYFPNRATGIENERDNARQLVASACTVSQYRIDSTLNIQMFRSNECVAPGSKMLVTTNIDGIGPYNYEWRWSFDGINYSSTVLDTTSSFLVTLQQFSHTLFVQVTVTASDGQVGTGTILIHVNDHCPFVDDSQGFTKGNKKTTVFLHSPHPNPAKGEATFQVQVGEAQRVIINLCDNNGNSVKNIIDGELGVGQHTFTIDISRYNNGFLYLSLINEFGAQSKKLLLLK